MYRGRNAFSEETELLSHTESGVIEFPYEAIKVEFLLQVA